MKKVAVQKKKLGVSVEKVRALRDGTLDRVVGGAATISRLNCTTDGGASKTALSCAGANCLG